MKKLWTLQPGPSLSTPSNVVCPSIKQPGRTRRRNAGNAEFLQITLKQAGIGKCV
tara:strand:- start:453 stop:617 length:165 start_codon:yes stop_codon:yes gene_type:complete